MNNGNYIQTILNAFSSMDIDTLRNQLKDEYSYQDTTKEIFLSEIEKLFKRRKNADDTKLNVYEGKCINKTCPSYGKRGYRFVGNHSDNYIDLIFVTEKDDIINIYSCKKFKTDVRVKKSIKIGLIKTKSAKIKRYKVS